MDEVARDLLRRVGIAKDIPPATPIGSLSGGERQAVAIARAMHFDSELIILDEPTNNLGVAETQGVLRFVRNARDSGHSCIFIAHNIHHVFQVVDRIVVMRRGRVVADDIDPKQTSVEEVERVITGMSDEQLQGTAAPGGGAMSERFHATRAEGIARHVDLAVGHIRSLDIERDGRRLTPLYTAPWVDDPAIANDEFNSAESPRPFRRFLLRPVRRQRRGGRAVAWLAGQFALGSYGDVPPSAGRRDLPLCPGERRCPARASSRS